MEDIISNAKKMAINTKSNILSLRDNISKKISESFSDSKDSNKTKFIIGYLLLMLIIIIVLIMSYNEDVDLSSTSSCVFMGESNRNAFWV